MNQAGLIKHEEYKFTSKARIFEKRFEAFGIIQQPPPLNYDDYLKGSDFSRVSQYDLLVSTSECFQTCKGMVDQLLEQLSSMESIYSPVQEDELRRLAKVCIGNSVFVQKLKQKIEDPQKTGGKITLNLDSHTQFCTIKIL